MTEPITVVIPVGPFESNKRWLRECLESVHEQTVRPEQVLLISDGAQLANPIDDSWVKVWRAPWLIGVATAFNFGVMLAKSEAVFMLGSDDTLEPQCLEKCLECYTDHGRHPAYYYVGVKYMDTGEIQTVPCNAAMTTKGFWRQTGGFSIYSPSSPDTILLSICLKHRLPVYPVSNGEPLYNYRRHSETDTAKSSAFHEIRMQIRDIITRDWERPTWTQNY